jgi:hypothetical protein
MQGSKAIIVRVTLKILRPLIRMLLRFEIAHSEFAELAKRAYVDVAYRHYSIPKRKQTYSRVAVITGLSRKEVVRLHDLDENATHHTKGALNRATRVIGGWMTDAEFLNDQRQPKDLPLHGETGSFDALVARYSGDITARAILDELVRVGSVVRVDPDSVHLVSPGYIPKKSETELMTVAGRAVTDQLRTVTNNIMDPLHPRFQRQTSCDDLPISAALEFQIHSSERCRELLHELEVWLAEKSKSTDSPSEEARVRVGVGLYYFQNDNEEE